MGNLPRAIAAFTLCILGANLLRLAPRIFSESVVSVSPFKESFMTFLGWFLIAYGLRIAIVGLPRKNKFFQIFITAPLMIVACLLVCRAGVYLIFINSSGTDTLNTIGAIIGMLIAGCGILYGIKSKWEEPEIPWTTPW